MKIILAMQQSVTNAITAEQMAQLVAMAQAMSEQAKAPPPDAPPAAAEGVAAATAKSSEAMEVEKKTPEVVVAPDLAQRERRQAEVDKLPGFADISADYKPTHEQVTLLLTPAADELNNDHLPMLEIEEAFQTARGDMAALLSVKTKVLQFLQSGFYFDESGKNVTDGTGKYSHPAFLVVFPDGANAIELVKDKDDVNEQLRITCTSAHAKEVNKFIVTRGGQLYWRDGELMSEWRWAIAVPSHVGRQRSKRNVVPAEIVRQLDAQIGKTVGVFYDRKSFPGMRIYAFDADDEEAAAIATNGGITLLGDQTFDIFPWQPRTEKIMFFLNGMMSQQAVERDVAEREEGEQSHTGGVSGLRPAVARRTEYLCMCVV
jgi:hypothetical protein